MKPLNSIITELIDTSIAEYEKNPTKEGADTSVLQKLLKIDKKVAIVMALDMLMAGVDTVYKLFLLTKWTSLPNDVQNRLF